MSNSNINNYKSQEVAFHNGKLVKILSVGCEYVTIEDAITGFETSIPKSELAKTSVYSYPTPPNNDERKEAAKKKIAELVAMGKEAEAEQQAVRKQKTGIVSWLNNFCREHVAVSRYQLSSENRKEFDPKYYEKYDLSMLATNLGNKALSFFNQATREAYNMRYLG